VPEPRIAVGGFASQVKMLTFFRRRDEFHQLRQTSPSSPLFPPR
jgi:hypothetical protein